MQESDMELILLSCLLLLSLLLSLALRTFYYPSLSPPPPPGHTGWPFFGETLQFFSTARRGIPEKFFADRMRIHSPAVFKTSLLGDKTAVFCGPEGNKFLFSNENRLVASWWPRNVEKIFPTSLQTSAGEESGKTRKMLPGFLRPDSLREYVGVMDSIARQQLDAHWSFRKEVTVLPLAKKYTFAVAARLFLSIGDDDPRRIAKFEKPFRVLVAGILSIPINFPGTPFNRAIKAAGVIRKEVLEIIGERKRNPTSGLKNDILDHMMKTRDESGGFMTEPEIADKIIGLLIGGHDTASTAIAFIVKYLAELPEIYQNVLKEQREIEERKGGRETLNWEDVQKMKYTWNVASEALRLAPPLQGSFRIAIAGFTYAGFSIPKGWKLYWSTHSTHKNPDYFPEPERFDPGRFEGKGPMPYTYVPFGGGPRMCPGKEYARLEILVFMYNLVKKFRWEKVIPEEGMIVDPMPMPAHGLPVRLRRY